MQELSSQEFEDAQGDAEEALVALQEVHIQNTRRHIEGQIISKHRDEPIACIDVRRDALLAEVIVKVWQVHLGEHLELVAEDSEGA